MVLSNWACMEGARVNCATTTVGGEKFREGGVEVVRDEGGNDIFVAIRNDKEMVGACCGEVVPPAGTREDARLRTVGTGGLSFCVSIHGLGFQ